jgi:protein-S-isoprenylcysteine O-methyltransferase Ste14
MLSPRLFIIGLWALWIISWFAAMRWTNDTEKRVSFREQVPYHLLMLVGIVCLAVDPESERAPMRLWHVHWYGAWICVLLETIGFAFTWWARIHLGKLWSGTVTRKADHHVVDTGPYAIVRHPIYTGLLLAVFATGAAKGTITGVLACLFFTLSFWVKAQLEERWLSQELGAEAYASYRRRVPMLLPFGPRPR